MVRSFTITYAVGAKAISKCSLQFEILDSPIGGKDVLLFDNDKAYRFAFDYFNQLHSWDIHMAAKHFNGVLYYSSICRDTERALSDYEHRYRKLPEGVIYDPDTCLTYFPSVEMLRSFVDPAVLDQYPID